jgi:hypothetical protein
MGRIPEAIEQFEDVLQINPDNQTARNNLAQLRHLPGSPAPQ